MNLFDHLNKNEFQIYNIKLSLLKIRFGRINITKVNNSNIDHSLCSVNSYLLCIDTGVYLLVPCIVKN